MTPDPLDGFLASLGALYRARRLYPAGNEQVTRAARRAADALAAWGAPVRVAVLSDEAVVEDRSVVLAGHPVGPLLRELVRAGCENLQISPGVTMAGLTSWVEAVLGGRGAEGAPGIAVGALRFVREESSRQSRGGAFEYLDLLPQVEEALAEVAAERRGGLVRSREIVHAIAGHLAVGEHLLDPIRRLKGHDNYTFTHAVNVCVLSTALVRALGAPPELVDQIALAGLCHDVGKQHIPLEVLNFRGALSPEDRSVMDGHPAHGARLLLAAGDGAHPLAAVIAYQHHLGADCSGYPRVPGAGRPHPASLAVAVADVFDAMRTVRPYRSARSTGEACTALVEEATRGRLNRRHVSAFLRIFRIMVEGRPVELDDGRRAVVLVEGASDSLQPVVEAADGAILDLAVPGNPRVARLLDASPSE